MTFPVIRDFAVVGGGAFSSVNVVMPAHVPGDVLLVSIRHGLLVTPNAYFIDASAGWTAIDTTNYLLFYKIAASSSEPALSINWSSTTRTHSSAIAVGGVDTAQSSFIEFAVSEDVDTTPTLSPSWGASDTLWLSAWNTRNRAESTVDLEEISLPGFAVIGLSFPTGASSTQYATGALAAKSALSATEGGVEWSFPAKVRKSVQRVLTIALRPVGAGGATAVNFTGTVPTLNGTAGTAFSQSVASYFGGSETPFAYAVHAGTLPAGLTLNASTGAISGTPTTSGTVNGIVIRATDATPDTADTNAFDIVIAAAAAPPTGTVTISEVVPGVTSATVTYSYSASDQTGFEYRIDGDEPASLGASPATVSGLDAATSYNTPGLEIRAINADGPGAWSSPTAFTTEPQVAAPSTAPANVQASAFSSSRIDVTFNAVDGATGYRVEIDSGAPIDIGDVLLYQHSGLVAESSHDYRVLAYNAAGDGPWSAVVSEASLPSAIGALRLRLVIDSAIGQPLVSRAFPKMVVFDSAGYDNVTASFAAPLADSMGVVTLELGPSSNYTFGGGEWVWVACAEQAGTPGQIGYEINGILTRVLVEEYTP